MRRFKVSDERKLDIIKNWLAAKKSGVPTSAFAREFGVPTSRIHEWHRQLREKGLIK